MRCLKLPALRAEVSETLPRERRFFSCYTFNLAGKVRFRQNQQRKKSGWRLKHSLRKPLLLARHDGGFPQRVLSLSCPIKGLERAHRGNGG